MQDNIPELKKAHEELSAEIIKLIENTKALKEKDQKLEQEIRKLNKPKRVPEEVLYDADDELNDLLKDKKVHNKIECLNKAYKHRQLFGILPLIIYAILLPIIGWLIFSYKLFTTRDNRNYVIMLGIMALGYILIFAYHSRQKLKINQRLAVNANDLSRAVEELLSSSKLNPEYLSYLLSQRVQERQRLDQQFSKTMSIISATLKLPLLLGIVVEGIFIHALNGKVSNSIIWIDIVVIVIIIALAAVMEIINCYGFNAKYYSHQTLMDAVNKFKIEDWDKDKTDC